MRMAVGLLGLVVVAGGLLVVLDWDRESRSNLGVGLLTGAAVGGVVLLFESVERGARQERDQKFFESLEDERRAWEKSLHDQRGRHESTLQRLVFQLLVSGNTSLSGLDVSGQDLRSVHFRDQRIRNSAFDGCSLQGSTFIGCRLVECSFRDANLSGGSFEGSFLESVDFTGSDLEGVDFSAADLSQVRLDEPQSSQVVAGGGRFLD